MNIFTRMTLIYFCTCCMIQTGYAAPTFNHASTAKVEAGHQFISSLTWFGRVQSGQRITIPARVNGLIVSISVADEAVVKQGDVLFTLAGKEVESRALNLQQQVQQARKEVTIAKKNLHLKRNQRQQGLATNEQVNRAEQALTLAQAHASTARQALVAIHAGSRITAPMNGIFTARAVHVGQYVSNGMMLASIVDPDHRRIQASLFAPAGMALKGQSVVVHAPGCDVINSDVSDCNLHAVISAIMPESSAQGAIQIWIGGGDLRALIPGMQISGELTLAHTGLAVSESAIARDDAGNSYVFIRNAHDWRKQQVSTGIHDEEMVEVLTGLHDGDKVLSEGVYELLYQTFGSNYQVED